MTGAECRQCSPRDQGRSAIGMNRAAGPSRAHCSQDALAPPRHGAALLGCAVVRRTRRRTRTMTTVTEDHARHHAGMGVASDDGTDRLPRALSAGDAAELELPPPPGRRRRRNPAVAERAGRQRAQGRKEAESPRDEPQRDPQRRDEPRRGNNRARPRPRSPRSTTGRRRTDPTAAGCNPDERRAGLKALRACSSALWAPATRTKRTVHGEPTRSS